MFVKWKGSLIHEADRLTRLVPCVVHGSPSAQVLYGYTLCGRTVPDGAWERKTEVETCSICARKARGEKRTQTQKEK